MCEESVIMLSARNAKLNSLLQNFVEVLIPNSESARHDVRSAFFQNLLYNAKANQTRRYKQKDTMAPSFTLTVEDLQALYNKQNMMGFYSHIPLNLRPLSNWQASLERVDPSCVYVHDNVVLEAL
eukprot:498946_1